MKLPKKYKYTLYTFLSLSFISGSLWFGFERWVRVAGALGEDRHPAQAWFLRFHGIIAWAVLLSLGYLIRVHVQPGLKVKRGRRSGIPMVAYLVALIVTALVQLYGSEGGFRDQSALIHSYIGLGLPVVIAAHVVLARAEPKRVYSWSIRALVAATLLSTLLLLSRG